MRRKNFWQIRVEKPIIGKKGIFIRNHYGDLIPVWFLVVYLFRTASIIRFEIEILTGFKVLTWKFKEPFFQSWNSKWISCQVCMFIQMFFQQYAFFNQRFWFDEMYGIITVDSSIFWILFIIYNLINHVKKSIVLFILSYALLFFYTFFANRTRIKRQSWTSFCTWKKILSSNQMLGEKRIINVYYRMDIIPSGHHPLPGDLSSRWIRADGTSSHPLGLMQFYFPGEKTMPPSILIGIANVDRKKDFTHPTRIEKTKRFFRQPGESANLSFIEKNYNHLSGTAISKRIQTKQSSVNHWRIYS